MVIENPLAPFFEWIQGALSDWAISVAALAVLALFLGGLVAIIRNGPFAGLRTIRKVVLGTFVDLVRISPRRTWALASLAFKESIRRGVLIGFVVLFVVFLFGAWFLDVNSTQPARLYITVVLTVTTWLVLLLMLFLSAFSLPADLKNRTLHTVVTKPVRASEVVLGRMIGFTLIGTGLLVVMSVISYVFVVRGVNHTHQLVADDLRETGQAAPGGARPKTGFTDLAQGHRHRVYIDSSGKAEVFEERSHWHELEKLESGGKTVYRLGPPQGMLEARVPIYGKLRFRDNKSTDTDKGINVGDEWMYRSFVEGDSLARAIWTFQGINESKFPKELPIEMNIEVFRTYKADIEKGVMGGLGLRNPKTGLYVEVQIFESREFGVLQLAIPRKITRANMARADMISRRKETSNGIELEPPESDLDPRLAKQQEFDLYRDLVADGELEVWLRCVDHSQYFGAGQSDLYIRAADVPFWWNFFKGYLGIWLQMVLVIVYGVMFSTFLSGPIAMLGTAGMLLGGMFSDFLRQLAMHQVYGGGPFEAVVRLLTQENLMTDLQPGLLTDFVKMADKVAEFALRAIATVLPPFDRFSYTDQVANGFDITFNPYVLDPVVMALGYILPVFVAGYLFLKTREVAR